MKTVAILLLILFLLGLPLHASATSILEIPRGTIFKLLRKIEIPANRDFIMLGWDNMDEAFNTTGQMLDEQAGRTFYDRPGYLPPPSEPFLTFDDFVADTVTRQNRSYIDCLERHRVYYRIPGTQANSTIIQQGHGNIAIIQNNGGTPDRYVNSIGENYCAPPEHTVAALVIDKDEADGGGILAEGYEFKVRKVNNKDYRNYSVVGIHFEHPIIKGIMVMTTRKPSTILSTALEASRSGKAKGFWQAVGNALVDMKKIGGNAFAITPPGKRYYN